MCRGIRGSEGTAMLCLGPPPPPAHPPFHHYSCPTPPQLLYRALRTCGPSPTQVLCKPSTGPCTQPLHNRHTRLTHRTAQLACHPRPYRTGEPTPQLVPTHLLCSPVSSGAQLQRNRNKSPTKCAAQRRLSTQRSTRAELLPDPCTHVRCRSHTGPLHKGSNTPHNSFITTSARPIAASQFRTPAAHLFQLNFR